MGLVKMFYVLLWYRKAVELKNVNNGNSNSSLSFANISYNLYQNAFRLTSDCASACCFVV